MADEHEVLKLEVSAAKINSCVKDHHDGKLLANAVYIKKTDSAAQIRSKLIAGGPRLSIVFDNAEYTIDEDIFIYDVIGLNIDFNGATFTSPNANGNVFSISTTSETADKYYRMVGASSDWFVSDMAKGSYYLEVTNPANWSALTAGDMVIIGDNREVPGVLNSLGLIFIFNRLEEVSGVWRLYFDYPSRSDLQCKTNLKNVTGFGGGYYVCHVPLKGDAVINNGTFNNCKFQLVGFQTAKAVNIVQKQDVFPFASDDQVGLGLEISYCKDIFVNKLVAHGFNQTGYGYGFTSLAWDKLVINNFIGYNCKHCFTTSTSYYHYSNVVEINDCTFASTTNQNDNDSTNGSPVDQHAGVWEVKINGITGEGHRPAVHFRGVNCSLKNGDFHNCKLGITVDTGEPTDLVKERLLVDTVNFIDHKGGVCAFGSNLTLTEAIFNNIYSDQSSTPSGTDVLCFYTMAATSYVENLTIKNSKFNGRIRNNSLTDREEFLSISNDNTTPGINSITVKNCEIKNWKYIFRSGLPKMKKILFKNCEITGFVALLSTGNLTTAEVEGYPDVEFKNCEISVGYTLVDLTNSVFLSKKIKFTNCDFHFIAYNFINYTNNKLENIIYKGNNFYNSFYSGRFLLLSSVEITRLIEQGNTFHKHSQAETEAIITAYAGTGYVLESGAKFTCMGMQINQYNGAATEVDTINNTYLTTGYDDEFFNLTGAKWKCSGNKLFLPSLNYTKLIDLATCNAEIINNDIVLDSLSTTTDIIESSGAGGITKVVGNNIINNSSTGLARQYDFDDISYLDLGNNVYRMNTASTIDNCVNLGA